MEKLIEPGKPGRYQFRVIQRPGHYSANRADIKGYTNDPETALEAVTGSRMWAVQWCGPSTPFDGEENWEYGDVAERYSYDGLADRREYRRKMGYAA